MLPLAFIELQLVKRRSVGAAVRFGFGGNFLMTFICRRSTTPMVLSPAFDV